MAAPDKQTDATVRVRRLADAPLRYVTAAGRRLGGWLRPITRRLPPGFSRSIALALLLVTSACVFIPFLPVMPGMQLDESWALGMNQAVAQGLVIGRDILFTFGPYSAIFSEAYHPSTDVLTLIGSGYLAICYWLALVQLCRAGKWYLPWAMVIVLAGLLSERDARDALLLSYPLLVGLAGFQLATRPPGAPGRFGAATASVLSSGVGLLLLIKGSMAGSCGLIGAVVIGLCAIQRRWRLALVLVVSPLAGMVVFWLLAAQPVAALPGYLRGMLPFISGYADAMAVDGARYDAPIFLIGALLLLVAAVRERTLPARGRRFLFGVLLAYLFAAFKAGFVRHDAHAVIGGQSLVIAAVVFSGLWESRLRVPALVASLLAWGYIDHLYVKTTPGSFVTKLEHTYSVAKYAIGKRLTEDWPRNQFDGTLRWVNDTYRLSQLDGTTDVYSFDQTVLLASSNRWNPRPVFQSYANFDGYLDARNREHLLGDAAPDNVLFRLATIDERFPPLDDGASWPLLLARYQLVGVTREFLVLRKRGDAAVPAMTTLRTSEHVFRKPVTVPETDSFVMAEISVEPNALGIVEGLAFKRNTLLITVSLASGQSRTYRYIASIGKLGIMISPLIETTAEFAALYAATSTLDAKQARSFSIAPQGSTLGWKPSYRVTFRTAPLRRTLDARHYAALAYPGQPIGEELPAPADSAIPVAPACDGRVDNINGYAPPPGQLSASGLLQVTGWVVRDVKTAELPAAVAVMLADAAGHRHLYPARPAKRPDTGKHSRDPRYDASGYTALIDVSRIDGAYTLGIVLQDGDRFELCPKLQYSLSLKAAAPP